MEMLFYITLDSPLGKLLVASSEEGVVRIILPRKEAIDPVAVLGNEFPGSTPVEDYYKNIRVVDELKRYFDGCLRRFSVNLDLRGTGFQRKVWEAVSCVPYGQTRSYGEIAKIIGNPGAARAVGQANRRNPVPIIVPCHRILGANGSLTGFGGGIEMKKRLLELEGFS